MSRTPKSWNDDIPDTSAWQPRTVGEQIAQGFALRCRQVGERIIREADAEREAAVNNFDPGSGIEDIVRRELRALLPKRYDLLAATLDDRDGRTAGDCDVVIADQFWAPLLKAGATEASRLVRLPVEAVYGVLEVKQTLDFLVLDTAMEKLVKVRRLTRPAPDADYILENLRLAMRFEFEGKVYEAQPEPLPEHPVFTAILAVNVRDGITLQQLVKRWVMINRQLKRSEVIQSLCVLREGTANWVWMSDEGPQLAFIDTRDENRNLFPISTTADDNPFYAFVAVMLQTLFGALVDANDIPVTYGPNSNMARFYFSTTDHLWHPPDGAQPEQSFSERDFLAQIYKTERPKRPEVDDDSSGERDDKDPAADGAA